MVNYNRYTPPKIKKQKTPAIEIQKQRIDRAITMIKVKDEISDYNLQMILEWGIGVHERITRMIRNNFQDEVKWNKKTRLWKFIGKHAKHTTSLEEPQEEKPNVMCIMEND